MIFHDKIKCNCLIQEIPETNRQRVGYLLNKPFERAIYFLSTIIIYVRQILKYLKGRAPYINLSISKLAKNPAFIISRYQVDLPRGLLQFKIS